VPASETAQGRRHQLPCGLAADTNPEALEERREDIKLKNIRVLKVPQETYVLALRLAP